MLAIIKLFVPLCCQQTRWNSVCDIWGSHSIVSGELGLLGYDTVTLTSLKALRPYKCRTQLNQNPNVTSQKTWPPQKLNFFYLLTFMLYPSRGYYCETWSCWIGVAEDSCTWNVMMCHWERSSWSCKGSWYLHLKVQEVQELDCLTLKIKAPWSFDTPVTRHPKYSVTSQKNWILDVIVPHQWDRNFVDFIRSPLKE